MDPASTPGPWPPWDSGPVIPTWRPDLLPVRLRPIPDVEFIPSPPEVVDTMLALVRIREGDVLYDLGCGDGRIVVAAAKRYGIRAIGLDIDRRRLREAAACAEANGVSHLATFREADIFQEDLGGATVVTLYLLPRLNDRLRPRLERLRPGVRIVSHAFGLWRVKPRRVEMIRLASGSETPVYLWETPLEAD